MKADAPDAALQGRIDAAAARAVAFLAGLEAGDRHPPGVLRFSETHDPAAWPGMLLPATYNGVMCLDLLGALDDWPGDKRRGLSDWLLTHQRADGAFQIPGMSADAVFKKPDPAETWRYIDFHVTNYALGAVGALTPEREAALDFVRPWLDPLTLKAWLSERDLRDPWLEGNNIVNLASFLLLLRDEPEAREAVETALAILFDWHDRLQEPATGFWGVGQMLGGAPLLHAMAGSMHNFHLWYALGRPLAYQDRAVDYVLGRAPVWSTACIDVDEVDLLVHAADASDYRRAEIDVWLRRKLLALLAEQGPDGGFCDTRDAAWRQDGWVGGPLEPPGAATTFATWFRWIAIAMIDDRLSAGAARLAVSPHDRHRLSGAAPMTEVFDPFAHLHEEDYERDFQTPRLTAAGMIATQGRPSQSLNGPWDFILDPFREGLRQRWFAEDATPIKHWTTPRDYDGGGWRKMAVPGCWNLAEPALFHYEGAAWYARALGVPAAAPGERLFLRVGAASGRCRVFLDGAFLGVHHGGSTPFFVEITGRAHPAAHLMLEVDNTRRADAVPMDHVDWFNYGGLHRGVEVFRVPACFIRDFRLALAPDGEAIDIRLRLSEPIDADCVVTIDGLGETVVEVRGGVGAARWPCAPERWSPDNPRLYDVTARCGADVIADRVGFRTIETRGHEILLNGAPIRLRGICVHEDDRETGRCSDEADIRRRFDHIRALGGNAARLAHYPHDERAAQIADERGILLWEEIPVYWAIAFDNPATLDDAKNQLAEMIARDANRASVIIWGVGNENADTDARLSFMRALAQAAKADDPTRLTAAACLINRDHFRIEDRLAEHLDVIGLNEYFGWYEPGYENLARLYANSRPDRPVVVSETGADAAPGLHGDPAELFTEERQAEVLATQARMADAVPYIAGFFPWLLYDFRSERRQTARQRGWNLKGVIAADKTTRKRGFDALRDAYRTYFTKGGTGDGRG